MNITSLIPNNPDQKIPAKFRHLARESVAAGGAPVYFNYVDLSEEERIFVLTSNVPSAVDGTPEGAPLRIFRSPLSPTSKHVWTLVMLYPVPDQTVSPHATYTSVALAKAHNSKYPIFRSDITDKALYDLGREASKAHFEVSLTGRVVATFWGPSWEVQVADVAPMFFADYDAGQNEKAPPKEAPSQKELSAAELLMTRLGVRFEKIEQLVAEAAASYRKDPSASLKVAVERFSVQGIAFLGAISSFIEQTGDVVTFCGTSSGAPWTIEVFNVCET